MARLIASLFASSLLLALSACSSDPEPAPPATSGGSGGTTSAGKGGTTSGGSGGGAATDPTVPASTTDAAVWDAFMTAKGYTMNGWISDVAAPRAAAGVSSPHGRVRVWFNPTLVASQDAGNGAMATSPQHTLNSMAVKELYDDADMLVGHAAALKVDGTGGGGWVYYCKAPANRCYSSSPDLTTPLFGKGESNCAFCHGGFVFTQAP